MKHLVIGLLRIDLITKRAYNHFVLEKTMADTLRDAMLPIRKQLEEKIAVIKNDPSMAEILRLHAGLNTLEGLAGDSPTSLAQLFGMELTAADTALAIRADEFYGLQPLEAAKRYLKKRGEARPFQEIVAAIRSGGCRVDSEEDLRLSLARSTYEVAKVNEDTYGLVEFYAHVKRERGRRKKGLSGTVDEEEIRNGEDEADAEETPVEILQRDVEQ